MVDQALGGGVAMPGLVFGQDRHEGLREGALGKQAAQQVGDAKRDNEGVGVGRLPEGAREQALAQQSGNPGQHRHAGNCCEGSEQVHGARL